MTNNSKSLGLLIGILVFVGLTLIPINGLDNRGQLFLALTMMTVVFWGFQVSNMGYISGLYLALLVVLGVGEPSVVFSPWVGSTIYFVIGAYLIASAVTHCGLGERIAMYVISKYITSFRSIIVVIFVLQILLSLLIPNSWARSLIIMAVMRQVIDNAKIGKNDATIIGLTVFAASVPTSMLFLTGESAINLLIVEYSGLHIGWLQWIWYMGPPAIAAIILTMVSILVVFRPEQKVEIDKQAIKTRLAEMGTLTAKEIRVIVWLAITILAWMTDIWHGIDIGWITLFLTMLMGMPIIGEVVGAKQWSEVPLNVLVFLTAAIAIGRVGAVTGNNEFLAHLMFPEVVPQNIIAMAVIVMLIAVAIHMMLGSVIAVLSVVVPATLAFTAPLGINPLVPLFIVYVAVFGHYVFPFHSISILVGVGKENGLYSGREVMKLGLPLFIMVLIVVLAVQLPWWRLIGLI
ncbi:MAG: anion permease [Defluviitaleaceae bacterium]|nr:anion permease [Defluviitaleaceae bacterium]